MSKELSEALDRARSLLLELSRLDYTSKEKARFNADAALLQAHRDALASQPVAGEPVAIATDDNVERLAKACGWNNRGYMTPADYAIWCERMRDFVRRATAQTPAAIVAEPVAVGEKRNDLLAAAVALVDMVEGPNFARSLRAVGGRLKDTNEWAIFYVATRTAQTPAPVVDAAPPADGGVTDELMSRIINHLQEAKFFCSEDYPDGDPDGDSASTPRYRAYYKEAIALEAALKARGA